MWIPRAGLHGCINDSPVPHRVPTCLGMHRQEGGAWNIPRVLLCLRTAIRAGAPPHPWPESGTSSPKSWTPWASTFLALLPPLSLLPVPAECILPGPGPARGHSTEISQQNRQRGSSPPLGPRSGPGFLGARARLQQRHSCRAEQGRHPGLSWDVALGLMSLARHLSRGGVLGWRSLSQMKINLGNLQPILKLNAKHKHIKVISESGGV